VKRPTDAECNRFRALPCDFNAMVRAIYEAGRRDALEAAAKVCDHAAHTAAMNRYSHESCGLTIAADDIRALAAPTTTTGEKA
jgi:hypothetical protein